MDKPTDTPTIGPVEVGKVYDERSELSDMLAGGHLHLSYWYDDQDRTPAADASQRITRRVVDTLGLGPDDHLLDAGCGMGAPAIRIAEETGARVTGVTVSNVQVHGAEQKAKASGVADRVSFRYGDFMSLDFADGTFDAVMAIEALQECPDLHAALREFSRVLRAGGLIAISDYTTETAITAEQRRQFRPEVDIKLPTLPEWLGALRGAGFEVEEYLQCGPRVFGHRSRYLEETDAVRDQIVAKYDEETFQGLRQEVAKFFTFGPKYLGYAIISARKPRN
jgi:cyclopropane fatty-acyl-phospholipid synthase-like methyltransferase